MPAVFAPKMRKAEIRYAVDFGDFGRNYLYLCSGVSIRVLGGNRGNHNCNNHFVCSFENPDSYHKGYCRQNKGKEESERQVAL